MKQTDNFEIKPIKKLAILVVTIICLMSTTGNIRLTLEPNAKANLALDNRVKSQKLDSSDPDAGLAVRKTAGG
jgi:hypothetical protein